MRKLRLFVWTKFSPDYTDGLAFAIASDETEARKLIIDQMGYPVDNWGTLQILSLSRKAAKAVGGGG